MKTLILATAAVGALFAAGSASAQSFTPLLLPNPAWETNSVALISQIGDANTATANQLFATDARAVIFQGKPVEPASGNNASVVQGVGSSGEAAAIVQFKTNNVAAVAQSGTNESASVVQSGNANTASVTQSGTGDSTPLGPLGSGQIGTIVAGNTFVANAPAAALDPVGTFGASYALQGVGIVQVGDRNHATDTQSGESNTAATIQVGADNTANIAQTGSFSDAFSLQTGTFNIASTTQNGVGDVSITYQNGNSNQAYVNQATSFAHSAVNQTGNGNISYVTQ